ncbi:uncharacterized protein LOC143552803 [Bidens hawaiensis]|uniref:uncharacterized protein LOC143552803 n=1 Tax=Bidens hawaiensis TaxID=980011 RepID=UPI00404ABD1E
MRCKKHHTDLSSIVGVCASCLRERLFYLVAAHEQAQTLTLEDININPVFPRSVSPYITRRRTDNQTATDANRNRNILPDRRFFSTPQLAPAAGDYNLHMNNINNNKKKKNNLFRFSLLSKLFRSKKQKEIGSGSVSDPRVSVTGGESATLAMSSPFRLRSGCGGRRKQYCSDRGMSPVRYSDYGGVEDEFYDGSSGYETCESRKQTPWRTPARRGGSGGGGGGLVKNVSGLNFCLSPLVRASPCRNWSVNGMTAADGGGDVRGPVKAHLANTKSFCANRSRKLADFGRFNSNR